MQTVYYRTSSIAFSNQEWSKIKSYASWLVQVHGADIEDRSDYNAYILNDEIHLIAREPQKTESFVLYQNGFVFSESDTERGYSFSFCKTYGIQPFETAILEILSYAKFVAPHVLLRFSADNLGEVEE